jgi:hypothetical protein
MNPTPRTPRHPANAPVTPPPTHALRSAPAWRTRCLRTFLASTLAGTCLLAGLSVSAQSLWKRTPIVKNEAITKGKIGGEGGQLIMSLAVSKTDANFLLLGTDVGGLQRSTDGGVTWQPSMRGYGAHCAYSIAIDPRNSNRAIVMAGRHTSATAGHQLGLWRTIDKGVSWTRVWTPPAGIAYGGGPKHQLAYDYLSYNGSYCDRIYWSSPTNGGPDFGGAGGLQEGPGGLYRSDDGGASFAIVNPSVNVSGSFVAVDNHNTNPVQTYARLYVGGANGFRYSDDRGVTFSAPTFTGKVSGLAHTFSWDKFVAICSGYDVHVSFNKGATWTKQPGIGLPTGTPSTNNMLDFLTVSPATTQCMTVGHWKGAWNSNDRYYSTNRGTNWTKSTYTIDQDFWESNIYGTANVWVVNAWHPSNTNIVFAPIRSKMLISTNRGAEFKWHNDGNSLVQSRDTIAFNVHVPNALAMAFQDHRGSLSTNANRDASGSLNPTWRTLNAPKWNSSGAYAFDSQIAVVGAGDSWDGVHTLYRTTNGGVTMTPLSTVTVDPAAGNELQRGAYGDPTTRAIAFWYHWRTLDYGATWTQMTGTNAPTVVFTHNPNLNAGGKRDLYGAKANRVVKSADQGVTWTTVVTLNASFPQVIDVAYDQTLNRLYIIGDNDSGGAAQNANLFQYEGGILTDITSRLLEDPIRTGKAACTVAVDPVVPSVVYAGRLWNNHASQASVYRSTDSGLTWTILTPQPGTTYLDGGGHGTYKVRVHPTTRDLWVATYNYGLWRYPNP